MGYINAMPLEDETFEKIKRGEQDEHQITANDIIPFRSHQQLKVFLLSIAIAPRARQKSQGLFNEPVEKLLYGLVQKLLGYARTHHITVTEFAAVGSTPEGRRLCKMLGMKEVARDKVGNPIYSLSLVGIEPDDRSIHFSGLRTLLTVYRDNSKVY